MISRFTQVQNARNQRHIVFVGIETPREVHRRAVGGKVPVVATLKQEAVALGRDLVEQDLA